MRSGQSRKGCTPPGTGPTGRDEPSVAFREQPVPLVRVRRSRLTGCIERVVIVHLAPVRLAPSALLSRVAARHGTGWGGVLIILVGGLTTEATFSALSLVEE